MRHNGAMNVAIYLSSGRTR